MVGTGIQFLNRIKVRDENQPNLAEEIEEGDKIIRMTVLELLSPSEFLYNNWSQQAEKGGLQNKKPLEGEKNLLFSNLKFLEEWSGLNKVFEFIS